MPVTIAVWKQEVRLRPATLVSCSSMCAGSLSRPALRFGKDVFFVSVSKDPETDTPERLRRWGEQFGVGGGWTLVTGEKGLNIADA